MEANSLPTEGTVDSQGQEQETAQAPAVPPEVAQRLDELSGRFDQFEPVLGTISEALNQPEQEQEGEQDYSEYFDDDGGMTPEQLEQFVQQRAEQIATQKYGPLEQRLNGMESFLQRESFEALKEQYPELQDPKVDAEVGQQVQAFASRYGVPVDVDLIETFYLAGKARQQAQQGVPAGGQEVALEGGSAAPGQPEVNPMKERFMQAAQQGASGGVFGKPLSDLL
jgi:hypothetical protein